jgi:hypothetical protein
MPRTHFIIALIVAGLASTRGLAQPLSFTNNGPTQLQVRAGDASGPNYTIGANDTLPFSQTLSATDPNGGANATASMTLTVDPWEISGSGSGMTNVPGGANPYAFYNASFNILVGNNTVPIYYSFTTSTSVVGGDVVTPEEEVWTEFVDLHYGGVIAQYGSMFAQPGGSISGVIAPGAGFQVLGLMSQAGPPTGSASLGYTFDLQLSTSPIPEPSTYAALAGIGALGFAIWRRRAAVTRLRQDYGEASSQRLPPSFR